MAGFTGIRLDHAGIGAFLKSAKLAEAVHAEAEEIADRVKAEVPDDVPVVVDDYETDRAASSVTIRHPSGLARQAKYGTLTRAAGGGAE